MATQKKFLPKIYAPSDLSKKWFVYWYDDQGRRQRKYGDINTHNSAAQRMEAANRLKEQIEEIIQTGEARTIQQKIYDLLEEKRPEWRRKTYLGYKSIADGFFAYLGKQSLTTEIVQSFFADRRKSLHAATFNKYRTVLSFLFKAIGEGSAFQHIPRKKGHSTPARYFQRHQIIRLKNAIAKADPELWLYLQFIYYCALRPNGEVRRLKADDILLESAQIRVRGEIAKNKRTQYVKIPISFLPDLQFVKRLDPDTFLFASKTDATKPIGYNTMTSRHRKILQCLGFGKEYKLYSWKHTGAVEAILAGAHPKELQIHLRHASLDETDKYIRQLGFDDFSTIETKIRQI